MTGAQIPCSWDWKCVSHQSISSHSFTQLAPPLLLASIGTKISDLVLKTEGKILKKFRPLSMLARESSCRFLIPQEKMFSFSNLRLMYRQVTHICYNTPLLSHVRDYKVVSALKLRCSGCRFVTWRGRRRVVCDKKPRHKQKSIRKCKWYSKKYCEIMHIDWRYCLARHILVQAADMMRLNYNMFWSCFCQWKMVTASWWSWIKNMDCHCKQMN